MAGNCVILSLTFCLVHFGIIAALICDTENLQNSLLQALKCESSDNESVILTKKIFNNTNLNLVYLNDSKIYGIEDESFTGLSEVEELYLNNNELTRISRVVFIPLQKLKKLDLSWNQINTIMQGTFEFLKDLSEVILAHNNISTFSSFAHEYGQVSLDLSWNHLKTIDFDFIHTLHINYTTLSKFKITGGIKHLYAAHSRISSFDVGKSLGVETLQLRNNSLQNINNITSIASCKFLDLSQNNFPSYGQSFYFHKMLNLVSLNLSSSQFQLLSYGMFWYQTNLKVLDLSFIRNANYYQQPQFHIDFLYGTNLRELYLTGNQLSQLDLFKILESFPDMEVLGIAGNSIPCQSIIKFHRKYWMSIKFFIPESLYSISGSHTAHIPCA